MDKKLRVAIVGCGRVAVVHIAAVAALNQARLIAFCDIKRERAAEQAAVYGGVVYDDFDTMLDKEDLDAVHLCLPHYLHTVMAKKAMEKGVNVLTEKPMSIDYPSAAECVEHAKKHSVQYGVIFQSRYNSSSQLVKKALESGRLGRVLNACSTLTWARPDEYYMESDWKGTWEKEGGGVVIDQAIHSIDLVNWLIGEPVESVSASIANRGHGIIRVEDSAEGLITFRGGIKYGFYCMNNYADNEPISIKLYCENGKVSLSYEEAEIVYNDGTAERSGKDATLKQLKGAESYWGSMHERQIDQFYNSCLGLEKLQISGEEALKTQKIINAIYESGKTGKTITF